MRSFSFLEVSIASNSYFTWLLVAKLMKITIYRFKDKVLISKQFLTHDL
jgi:hypothetical protein